MNQSGVYSISPFVHRILDYNKFEFPTTDSSSNKHSSVAIVKISSTSSTRDSETFSMIMIERATSRIFHLNKGSNAPNFKDIKMYLSPKTGVQMDAKTVKHCCLLSHFACV